MKATIRRNKATTASLALALCLVLSACLMASCQKPAPAQAPPAYVSPYDWTRLVCTDGRYSYTKDGVPDSRTGVDVSDHQGVIDWEAVAADGIDFAIIRVGNRGYTEGSIYLDSQFTANLEGAKAAGILVGVYFFSQAVNEDEAREEADFVIENLDGATLDYPVVYDLEPVPDQHGRANFLSVSQATRNAQAFCERIQAAGYTPMIYGNKTDIARLDLKALGAYDIWFAEYGAPVPSGQFDFTMWQYTNSATVDGIGTDVDMNIHFLEP